LKRLIKNCENINVYDKVNVSDTVESPEQTMKSMVELDELSEADVRHNRCPKCKYNQLKQERGFKICPRCNSIYKVLDGSAFIIS